MLEVQLEHSNLLVGGDEGTGAIQMRHQAFPFFFFFFSFPLFRFHTERRKIRGNPGNKVRLEPEHSKLLVGGDEWSVVEGTISEVAMVHLLSPAADVSSSFTSLEEHCGENSTWRRNGGDFDCLKEKNWVSRH